MKSFGTGAYPSHYDKRTISHIAMAAPPTSGGVIYGPGDIEMQAKVGICTAASVVQNAEKVNGKKYSLDFHYLLLKKYFDMNWYEGSSIFNSLKVAKNYGFLPAAAFPYVTEADRSLPYSQYIAKLQAISDADIQKLISQCEDKLAGYAQLNTDPSSLAQGISDSQAGIICMLQSGSTWWTAIDGTISWLPKDIDPIRVPTEDLSGHAITASYFDFTNGQILTYPNTWSDAWDVVGNCHIDVSKYKMVEAWIPYYTLTEEQQAQIKKLQVTLIGLLGQILIALKQKIIGTKS
jgi:hypothetical protein